MFAEIEKYLIEIEKPGRYIGNEAGIPDKDFEASDVRMAISYPDVYEIGMSNYGIKILYDVINKLPFASCERVFSPWEDFEALLKKLDLPLFSLETKTALNK
ncbi:MAG: B12-binding domain-containing radical SAM protein, partial [Spirochaetota bacterium]|nr:B12-binding domain-containing radical SAM protein [Spirochaetota bacterium]